jgi:hypothetical protein
MFFTLNSISVYSQCLSGDCSNGRGIKIYPDSAKFEGIFEDGVRKNGKYTYASGDIYEGSFYKNFRHGYGVYNYKTGQVFRGIYKNDEKEYGIFRFKNGDQYTGTFVNNKPDGFGIMHFSDGRKLEGQWVDGKPQWSVSGDSLSFNIISDTTIRNSKELYSQEKLIPKMYAVVVGIADYEGTGSDLRYSDDDAILFYNHLKRAFSRELAAGGATLLIDSKATKSAIQNALSSAFSKATENDYIIFFFSGHGSKGTFVPYDLNSNSLSHQEVKASFKKSSAKYKLCIADACFAGSVGTENLSTSNYDAAQDLRDARLAVLLSSNNQQTSSEMSQLGQGLFSYWLMNGLRGAADLNRDKYVTAGELFVYTRNAVVNQSNGKQSPVIIGKNLDKIPLCRLK